MSLPLDCPVRVLRRPPDARWFMARAFLPRRGGLSLPALAIRLAPATPRPADVEAYCALTGERAGTTLPLAWPQVWSFRLQMALLTDRLFPLPIWNALQIRNRMLQHCRLASDASYAITVRAGALRRLDRGVEIDLLSELHDTRGQLVWEGSSTFYWRGRGNAQPDEAAPSAASPVLDATAGVLARWPSGLGSGWRFGALTGDYNGLHWSDRYARAFGFPRAFHHPPRVVGQCLAHLPIEGVAARQKLDLWIKGPVFYDREVRLDATGEPDDRVFGLALDADGRHALCGRWQAGAQCNTATADGPSSDPAP